MGRRFMKFIVYFAITYSILSFIESFWLKLILISFVLTHGWRNSSKEFKSVFIISLLREWIDIPLIAKSNFEEGNDDHWSCRLVRDSGREWTVVDSEGPIGHVVTQDEDAFEWKKPQTIVKNTPPVSVKITPSSSQSKNRNISSVSESHGSIIVYDENGTEMFRRTGQLVGYTGSTVTVRDHNQNITYNNTGTEKFRRS